jgi:hypothetical protein
MTIKDKLHVLVIGELLDELQRAISFTKLDLHYEYHQIIMKQEDIPQISF